LVRRSLGVAAAHFSNAAAAASTAFPASSTFAA
jgi:hypothetical protein